MKFTVCLRGLLLIFLLPRSIQSFDELGIQRLEEQVDIHTLARIINFFEQKYKRVDADGRPHQYAIAINVPKAQCLEGFDPSQNNFLSQEDANNVKNAINDESEPIYQGPQLIAAGTEKKKKYTKHSERLLLNPPYSSPMTNLFNRNNQNCSIFYTLNSPCFGTCLNEKGPFNIVKALDWSKRSGIKAFVFKDFYFRDTKKDLQSKFKFIAYRVPLYRCVSNTVCYACNGQQNTPIDENCLPPKTTRRSEL